jgi:long-subunit fatty acid transport protein
MKSAAIFLLLLLSATAAAAQDQQLGARTKAMGGSYTAFEDDPVSIWLNPAGIATQPSAVSLDYQTYVTYPLHEVKSAGATQVSFSAKAETTFVDPALLPSYLGVVFHLGSGESSMALGICYAQPYHLNYSFDKVNDPNQTQFTPDSNVDQSFGRFRVAFAKDFRFKKPGEPGYATHLSAGAGLDLGYERWEFKSAARSASDNATGIGGGLGLLLGLYDNVEDLRVNVGVAWQSAVRWNFSIDPDILPAFDMPQQVNLGTTFYLLKGFPFRATIDFQWIEWSETADVPLFPGKKKFRDAFNYSVGFEYRIDAGAGINLYPRLGYRRFNAPWSDKNNLPMTSDFQLVLDTKGSAFNIITLGGGISWSADDGRVRSVDLGADVGGDSFTIAFGINYEF